MSADDKVRIPAKLGQRLATRTGSADRELYELRRILADHGSTTTDARSWSSGETPASRFTTDFDRCGVTAERSTAELFGFEATDLHHLAPEGHDDDSGGQTDGRSRRRGRCQSDAWIQRRVLGRHR